MKLSLLYEKQKQSDVDLDHKADGSVKPMDQSAHARKTNKEKRKKAKPGSAEAKKRAYRKKYYAKQKAKGGPDAKYSKRSEKSKESSKKATADWRDEHPEQAKDHSTQSKDKNKKD